MLELRYHPKQGPVVTLFEEHHRDELVAASDRLDIRVGRHRIWTEGTSIRVKLDGDSLKTDFTFHPALPPHQFGNGRIDLYADRSAQWAYAIMAPRAQVEGRLTTNGKAYDLAGVGFHDRNLATIKMPTFLNRWFTLWIFADEHTLVLHELRLGDRFGNVQVGAALLGSNDRTLAEARNLTFKPTKSRTDPESGYALPTTLDIAFSASGYSVTGTLREARFLESIDVLGQISWPVRTVIKALYTKPYLVRYVADYDLDVKAPDGTSKKISGLGLFEVNYY